MRTRREGKSGSDSRPPAGLIPHRPGLGSGHREFAQGPKHPGAARGALPPASQGRAPTVSARPWGTLGGRGLRAPLRQLPAPVAVRKREALRGSDFQSLRGFSFFLSLHFPPSPLFSCKFHSNFQTNCGRPWSEGAGEEAANGNLGAPEKRTWPLIRVCVCVCCGFRSQKAGIC